MDKAAGPIGISQPTCCTLLRVVKPETAEAVRRANFKLVELTDSCWPGPRGISSGTLTGRGYEAKVGPWSSITLSFGDASSVDRWVCVDTTWPGEFDRYDAGNGFVGVHTFDRPAESKARQGLTVAASLMKIVAELARGAEHDSPEVFLSDDEHNAIDQLTPTAIELPLDGRPEPFCLVRAMGATAAAANFADRAVIVYGCFEPDQIELATVADVERYLT